MKHFIHGWKPPLPDHRNFKYKLTQPQLVETPQAVDLRDKCSPVESQGQLGSCTAHALSGLIEFNNPPIVPVSRLFIYYQERVLENDTELDNGASLASGCKVLCKIGVPPESDWPYDPFKFSYPPPQVSYDDAEKNKIASYHSLEDLDDMFQCLASGNPFVFGISIYESFEEDYTASTGIVFMPRPRERLLGGHALLAVGYDKSMKSFIFRNSWGTDWGKSGYGFLPFEYMTTQGDDFWVIQRSS